MWKRVMSLILTFAMVVGLMSSMGTVVEAAGTGTSEDPIVVYRNTAEDADKAATELNVDMNDLSSVANALDSFDVRNATRESWVEAICNGVEGSADVLYEVKGVSASLCNQTKIDTPLGEQEVALFKWFGWKAVNDGTTTETVKIVDAEGNTLKDDIVVEVKNHIDVKFDLNNGRDDSISIIEVPLNTKIKEHSSYDEILAAAENPENAPAGKTFAGWYVEGNGAVIVNTILDVDNAEDYEDLTFTATYEENVPEKAATQITTKDNKTSFGFTYTDDLTLDTLIDAVGATVVDADGNEVQEDYLSFECPLSVGSHEITLWYAENDEYEEAEEVKVTININSKSVDEVVLYRNPKKDYAATELTLDNFVADKFEVRDDVRLEWFAKVKEAAGLNKADDMQFTVTVGTTNIDANFNDETSVSGQSADAGVLLGWEAVKGGTAGKVSTTVNLVDTNDNLIATNIPVTVKGYVDVKWSYNGIGEPVTAQHALGSAINATASYTDIVDAAIENAPANKYFAGWATSEGATETQSAAELLDKEIDVTAVDDALAAETMNGKTFYAVYQDNPKLKTEIVVEDADAFIELNYAEDRTADDILAEFKPTVYSIDGTKKQEITDAALTFECPTGIGEHTVTIRYEETEEYYASSKDVTVTIKNKKDVSEEERVVLYRSPVDDKAGAELTLDSLAKEFTVRGTSKENWLNKVQAAAGLTNAADVQFPVTIGGVSITANLKKPTTVSGNSVNAGLLFGWEAVQGGIVGNAVDKTVKLVDKAGTVIATDIPVTVKGYVDVKWSYNGISELVTAQHALGSAINATSSYTDIVNAAKANAPANKYFAGWATSAGATEIQTAAELGLDKKIDVTAVDGALAAETMDGKTFYAVYQDNPVLDTEIKVDTDKVELKYDEDRTVADIRELFNPKVYAIDGTEEKEIENATVSFECSTGIGEHIVTIRYAGKDKEYRESFKPVTVKITNKKNVSEEERVVLYRNPAEDTAGETISTEEISKFKVRGDVVTNWLNKLSTAADLTNAADMQFPVKVKGVNIEAYLKGKTNVDILGVELNVGGLLGWEAVQGGKAGTPVNKTVKLLDKNGTVIATDIPVTVKGYVNVTWKYQNGSYLAKHALGSAIYGSETYKEIETNAIAAAPKNMTLAGWDIDGDGKVDTRALASVIDVIEGNNTILAEVMDDAEFTAVYQEKPVLDTRIVVENSTVEFEYSDSLTEKMIFEKINPVVKAKNEDDTYTKIEVAEGDIVFSCPTGIGTHTVKIQYLGKDGEYKPAEDFKVTVIIKGKVIDKTVVVYRNPVEDPAPEIDFANITKDDVTLDLFNKFIVRPETKGSWLAEAAEVAEANGAEDLQLDVREYLEKLKDYGVELDLEYVNVIKNTDNSLLGDLPLGNLFGFQAVQGGVAGTATVENVRIVGENDKVIADGLKFLVKGYVDITWKYGDQELKKKAALNKTILTAGYNEAITNARNAAEEGYKFKGWDINGDNEVDDVSAYFMKIIDVTSTSENGALAAKGVDGKVFTAIYEEGEQEPVVEKLNTTIVPSKTEVTFTYSSDLTKEAILKAIAPVVKDSNGNVVEGAKIDISCEIAAGTQTATLSYQGDLDNYNEAKDVTVSVVIKKAAPVMSVSSYTLKYGQTVTEDQVFSANCDTIKFLAGLDVSNPDNMISKIQLALPSSLMTIVNLGVQTLGEEIDLNNITIEQLQNIIAKAEEAGTDLGTYAEYLSYLDQADAFLQKLDAQYGVSIDLSISISDKIVMPTAIGVYAAGMMGSDNNYESDMAAGYILITPAMTKTTLSWNATDDNFVIGLDKTATFDFTAKATDAAVNDKIEYLFIGVDSTKDFVVNRVAANESVSAALNAVGVYAQLAYVADFGNEMFYAEPIVRPILVSPEIADVKFVSADGDDSLTEVFVYGDDISFDITVDGKENPAGTLYVKYAGSDITADGWYSDKAPTEPGMYSAVAVYGEKNDKGEVVKLGGAVKVFVIEKKDAELSMEDVKVEPDGEEHFTNLSDENMTYVTIALDDYDNAYINIPSGIKDQLESAVKKLPAKAEVPVSEFLEEHVYDYIGKEVTVDGDEYKEALEATIQELIDLNLSAEAKAEMDLLYEAVADKIAEYDIQSTIREKIEAGADKLNNYVTGVTPDILDEPLKTVMEAAIVIDGTDVYLDKAAAEAALKDIIAEFGDQDSFDIGNMSTEDLMAVAGIGAAALVVDKILAQNDGLDFIEVKVDEIKAEIEKLKLDDPKELAKQFIGALDEYLDEEELAKVYSQFFNALDKSGYVTELVTIIEGLAEMCDADTTEAVNNIHSCLDRLLNTLAAKTENGTLTMRDFEVIEGFIDTVLGELKTLVKELPGGTYYFGKNPSKTGVYNCYAINLSKYYKSEVLDAVLTIEKDEVVRIYGEDRYLTSMGICEELKEKKGIDKFDTIILATGEKFADALSATYLSYVADAPILLINRSYAEKSIEYLNANLKPGGTVYVIGGDEAISPKWLDKIDTSDRRPLWGEDRYETNLKVLEAAISEGGCMDEILVCSGNSYADCISASAAKRPIFLVSGKEPTEMQKKFLDTLNKNVEFYVVGGDEAVTVEMEKAIKEYGNVKDRVYGEDRFGTSYNVATKLVPEADSLIITYGYNFPDGICGGLLATTTNAAVVLAASNNVEWADDYVDVKTVSAGYVLGAADLLSDNTVANIYNITKDEIIQKEYKYN